MDKITREKIKAQVKAAYHKRKEVKGEKSEFVVYQLGKKLGVSARTVYYWLR